VAQQKGIYKKYSIESEYIQMAPRSSLKPWSPATSTTSPRLDRHFRGSSRITFGYRDQLLRQLAWVLVTQRTSTSRKI